MTIRPVAANLFQTDGRTDMTKLIATFRNFANASENLIEERKGRGYTRRRRRWEGIIEINLKDWVVTW
jgi:hypothetical protein